MLSRPDNKNLTQQTYPAIRYCSVLHNVNALHAQIKVDDDGKIVDAKFKTFGCGSAIASSSLATEWIKGKSVCAHSGSYH